MNTDSDRLEWIAENCAAIRKQGEHSSNPYYFVIYKNGSTSAADNNMRKAVDFAINQFKGKNND